MADGESLDFVNAQAVDGLQSQLKHRGLASRCAGEFLSGHDVDGVDIRQKVFLAALIRSLVVETRLHFRDVGANTAQAAACDRMLRRPIDESACGSVAMTVLHVDVSDKHDEHATWTRLAQQWRVTATEQPREAWSGNATKRFCGSAAQQMRAVCHDYGFDTKAASITLADLVRTLPFQRSRYRRFVTRAVLLSNCTDSWFLQAPRT